MIVKETKFQGLFQIELKPILDERGFFMRTYDHDLLEAYGMNREWLQENHSYNKNKGTIRGFHFQFPPFSETKLVRVVSGTIIDFFIDLRKNSQTFGEWGSIELSSSNNIALYIPRGFAHGMCTMEDDSTMVYKVDNTYSPNHEGTIKWNDPTLKISWPSFKNPIISEKDSNSPSFQSFLREHKSLELNNE